MSTLELHYRFADASHSMDAFVHNRCEHELLAAIRSAAAYFGADVIVETEPLADGGIKRIFRFITSEEGKKATISTALITALATALFITPVGKVSEKLVERLFEDPELKQLEKKKLRLEVEELERKKTEEEKEKNPDKEAVLRKHRSNFYESLDKYPKVQSVSFRAVSDEGEPLLPETEIPRDKFALFISTDDELPPLIDENAMIEIIAPVLKRGRYKWVGIYRNETIHFSMKSQEFKDLVLRGEVEFKNGSSIESVLQINRKIGSDGNERIVSYEVLAVTRYFENNVPIETSEGRKRRERKQDDANQMKLFE